LSLDPEHDWDRWRKRVADVAVAVATHLRSMRDKANSEKAGATAKLGFLAVSDARSVPAVRGQAAGAGAPASGAVVVIAQSTDDLADDNDDVRHICRSLGTPSCPQPATTPRVARNSPTPSRRTSPGPIASFSC
jgi:hypothetical protein